MSGQIVGMGFITHTQAQGFYNEIDENLKIHGKGRDVEIQYSAFYNSSTCQQVYTALIIYRSKGG